MIWMMSAAAWACAGLVHEEGEAAEATGVAVVLAAGDDTTEVTYEVRYEGDAEAFGWLIPIPGAFVDLADGDANALAQLSSRSAPSVTVVSPAPASGGRGCGPLPKSGGVDEMTADEAVAGNAVDVVAEGFTGTYAYTVLDADDPEALAGWFAGEGWSPGVLEDDLAFYTERGDAFVALTLMDDEAGEGPEQLPPLSITYEGNELSYPSVMARHAADDQRTTVYVLGDSRAEVVQGWSMVDEPVVEGPEGAQAAEVLDDFLAELGQQGTWLRTWSGSSADERGPVLTRFDLYAPPEQHVADVVFGFDGSEQTQSTTIWLEGSASQAAAWLMPWVLLGGLGLAGRRRSQLRR